MRTCFAFSSILFLSLLGCRTPSHSDDLKDTRPDVANPILSCTDSKPEQDGYQATFLLSETKLEIKQSSRSARYGAIAHAIETDTSLSIPATDPKFTCTVSKPEQDGYKATLSVYEDRVILVQSSKSARYAPAKYRIVN